MNTVADLIKRLQAYPPDMRVGIIDEFAGIEDVGVDQARVDPLQPINWQWPGSARYVPEIEARMVDVVVLS